VWPFTLYSLIHEQRTFTGEGRIGRRRRVMTPEVVDRARRMLENGATRQQVADVIGVGVKTVYKYFPAATPTQSLRYISGEN